MTTNDSGVAKSLSLSMGMRGECANKSAASVELVIKA